MQKVRYEEILNKAIASGIASPDLSLVGIMDFDGLAATAAEVSKAFGPTFRHAFAVKANALVEVLAKLHRSGMDAEVASPGELKLAITAGFKPEAIVLDSPAKTRQELRYCLEHDISFNIDNEQELFRVDALVRDTPNSKSAIGFRVNPQIGSGAISATSTATNTSKFGYTLKDGDNRAKLLKYYAERPWLNSIHTHTGSQGCPLDLMARGVKDAMALVDEINAASGRDQVHHIDIGGGLPVNFESDEVRPTFKEYADILRREVPSLFGGKFKCKTEFGRAVAAKNGIIVTRVEYTKESGGRFIAITHAGAQIFTRTAFLPQAWPIRLVGYAPNGTARFANPVNTDVAGPCCFAADLLGRNINMPRLQPDDYVLALDTGAYYFSNHFDYNSLPGVAVYAAENGPNGITLNLIRDPEDIENIVRKMSRS